MGLELQQQRATVTLAGLEAEGPALPRAARAAAGAVARGRWRKAAFPFLRAEGSPGWGLQTCLLTSPGPSSGPVHQQPPAAPAQRTSPHPSSPLPHWGSSAARHHRPKRQFRLQARNILLKKQYFSDDFPTGSDLEPTRKAWEQPAAATVPGVLAFWMPFPHPRWRTFMLPPVKYLWCHLQTPTAPADTFSLPLVPAARSRGQEPLLSAPPAVRRNPVTHRGCCHKCPRYSFEPLRHVPPAPRRALARSRELPSGCIRADVCRADKRHFSIPKTIPPPTFKATKQREIRKSQ